MGKWIQPGGHIEEKEDPQEAVIRETKEETGLTIKLIGEGYPRKEKDLIRPLALQRFINGYDHVMIDFVYSATVGNGYEKVNAKETNGLKWFSIDEIFDENFDTYPNLKFWCKKVFEDYNNAELPYRIDDENYV